MSVDSNIML